MKLPIRCEVNKVIPKKTFYERVHLSYNLKQEFIEKLERIYWEFKISQNNLNISKTDEIEEIEVFQLILKEKYNAKNIINAITKSIPYPILFKIRYNNEFMYAIKYDNEMLYSEWNVHIELLIIGLDLSEVYENLVRQVGNIENNNIDVKQEIEKKRKIEELKKQITRLKEKIGEEKQFNKKVELNQKLRELEKEKEILNNE